MSKRGADDLLVSPGPNESVVKKMDIKLTPTKAAEELVQEDKVDAVVAKIKQTDAPEWFLEAFTFIGIKEQKSSTSVGQKQLE